MNKKPKTWQLRIWHPARLGKDHRSWSFNLAFFDVWCFYQLMLQVIPKPGFIAEYFPMDPLIQIYQPRKLFDVSLQQSNPLAAIESIYSIIIIIIRLVYTVLCVKDYEDGIIPEGLDPDIVRTEKQLDFEEAWACACERGVSDAKIHWLLFHQSYHLDPFRGKLGISMDFFDSVAIPWQTEQAWQGLPMRYGGAFAARFTTCA